MSEWVDLSTGEIHIGWAEGRVEIPPSSDPSESFDEVDDDWVPRYYLRRIAELRASTAALKAEHARALRQHAAELKALDWRYKSRATAIVRRDLAAQSGRRKSVSYGYGSLSLTVPRRTDVTDEGAAIKWALAHRPEAVATKTTTRLLKSELPRDVEVPGISRPTQEELKVKIAKEATHGD